MYLEHVDYGNKTNRGGLKHMKVDNKVVRQYENVEDPDHDVVNLFVKHLTYTPKDVSHFYCRPLPDNGSGIPRYGTQPIGKNKLGQIIPDMCKEAGIPGRKTGHSGKVTCATTLYHQNFSDQQIKERTGHRSLEALHKYKRTCSDQDYEMSMALLPQLGGKENLPVRAQPAKLPTAAVKPQLATSMPTPAEIDRTPLSEKNLSDDEDFAPIKKKPKITPETLKCMFGGQSTIQNCTFNIQLQK